MWSAYGTFAQSTALHHLQSVVLGEFRKIQVSLPADYDTLSQPPPVIYILDGESRFDLTRAVYTYGRLSSGLPSAILVGLPSTDREERDFHYRPEEGNRPDLYLRHLAEEVIPYVDSIFRTAPVRYLVGHSHGGVFVLYTFLHRPEVFDGYLASDPSVKYLIGPARKLLRREYADRKLYLSATDVAYGFAEEVRADIHRDQAAFRQLLNERSPAGLRIATDHIRDDHGNGYLGSLSFGLRFLLFGWERPD